MSATMPTTATVRSLPALWLVRLRALRLTTTTLEARVVHVEAFEAPLESNPASPEDLLLVFYKAGGSENSITR